MTEMAIRCGDHRHETVAQVRACQLGTPVSPANPVPTPADWKPVADTLTREAINERLRRQAVGMRYGNGSGTGETARRTGTGDATPKQLKYVEDLLAQREIPAEIAERYRAEIARHGNVSFTSARSFINSYKDAPRIPARGSGSDAPLDRLAANAVTQDGMYRNPENGEIFKVQWNKAGGDGRALYAKQLVVTFWDASEATEVEWTEIPLEGEKVEGAETEFRYISGLIRKIRPEWRMSIDDAKRFGALYGTCLRCGRTLTLEASIERAMGRICSGKANWS